MYFNLFLLEVVLNGIQVRGMALKMSTPSDSPMDEDKEGWKQFDDTYKEVSQRLLDQQPELNLTKVYERIREVSDYNVTDGKRGRGIMTVKAFKLLAKGLNREVSAEELHIANIIGWSMEYLQGYATVADDIEDQSITRRSKLCWYKKV